MNMYAAEEIERQRNIVAACRMAYEVAPWRMGPTRLRELEEAQAKLRAMEASPCHA